MIEVSSLDRVLVLGLDKMGGVRALASAQALVGMGSAEEVRAARRTFADLENVMFAVGSRSEIPWQEHWFTIIVDRDGGAPTEAMLRVLADGGRIVTDV